MDIEKSFSRCKVAFHSILLGLIYYSVSKDVCKCFHRPRKLIFSARFFKHFCFSDFLQYSGAHFDACQLPLKCKDIHKILTILYVHFSLTHTNAPSMVQRWKSSKSCSARKPYLFEILYKGMQDNRDYTACCKLRHTCFVTNWTLVLQLRNWGQ